MTPRRTVLTASLTLALAAGIGLTPANAATTDAHVSILHAVPGATVDVYANGKAILQDFTPGTLTKPLTLPAGQYDLKVTAANAGASGKAIMSADDVTVPGGANITVVAHLSAAGTPELTPFVNDTTAIAAGKARLTVRHVAAAPAVDVRADGTVAFPGLTNPKEATAVLPAGTIKADVALAGTDTVAIGPADLNLAEGASTIVYAWGSAADKNLKLAVQTIDGMHTAPSAVQAGKGGATTGQDDTTRLATSTAAALAAAGLAAFAVSRTRRRVTERA